MFLAVDGVGVFAVVDGVPVAFPDLGSWATAKDASSAPVMVLPRVPGEQLVQELIKKHAKATS